jgi:hypothetical protein
MFIGDTDPDQPVMIDRFPAPSACPHRVLGTGRSSGVSVDGSNFGCRMADGRANESPLDSPTWVRMELPMKPADAPIVHAHRAP